MTQDRFHTGTLDPVSVGPIQPGSTVFGSDGVELGSVTEVAPDAISVKKRGFLGGTVMVSRALVIESDEGRVELSVPARDAAQS